MAISDITALSDMKCKKRDFDLELRTLNQNTHKKRLEGRISI